jgi:hypothetical protein
MLNALRRRLVNVVDIDGTAPYPTFDSRALHESILELVTGSNDQTTTQHIGASSGASSMFPSTIQKPVLCNSQCIEYYLQDGQFHDGHNYYEVLRSDWTRSCDKKHPSTRTDDANLVIPSPSGGHDMLMLSARGNVKTLEIRTVLQRLTKTVQVDFFNLHLTHLGVEYAIACNHDRRGGLSEEDTQFIVTTSVISPLTDDNDRLAIALAHLNPEAQFLCCESGVQILFQGGSCLNCAVQQARHNPMIRLLIQS